MPKIPAGMRKKGKGYEYRLTVAGRRISVSAPTVAECLTKAERQKAAAQLRPDAGKITLDQFYNGWIASMSHKVKRATVYSYNKKYKAISQEIGSRTVQSIRRDDLVALQNRFCAVYTSSTVNYYMSLVKRLLDACVASGIISRNPYISVDSVRRTEPKSRDTIHRALSTEEVSAFMEAAKTSYYYNLFDFLLNTGLRIGEAAALTWDDCSSGFVNVKSTVSHEDNGVYAVSTTKTAAGARVVPINDRIAQILSRQRLFISEFHGVRYASRSARVFPPMQDPEKLLKNSQTDSAVNSVLARMEKSGIVIPHFSVHAMRDTFATRCIEHGMQPNTLKEIMGHTKISITMDLYAHVSDTAKVEAMHALEV